MPFKIVQTRERGKNVLQIVPDKWEQNNILHWPKRNVERLLQIEDSCPDDSWVTFKCTVKRQNLYSLDSAEMEVARMSDMSDTDATDAEEERYKVQSGTKKTYLNNSAAVQQCFNDLASSCLADNVPILQLPEAETEVIDQNIIYVATEEAPAKLGDDNEIIQKIENLTEKFKSIEENQNVLCNIMQNLESNLLQKLAEIKTTFNAFVEHFTTDRSSKRTEQTDFIQISDKKSLDEFETNLKNPHFKTNIKDHLSLVCGKGKGRGNNNAYVLSDVLFSRNFLTQCSWTGGSRKEYTKICFKVYTNTVDLFFELIHQSDRNYTRQECELFFKNIMRHSNTRNKPVLRAAAGKSRSKRSSKNKQTILVNNQPITSAQPASTDNQSLDVQPGPSSVNQPVAGSNDQSSGGTDNQSVEIPPATCFVAQPISGSVENSTAGTGSQIASSIDN